MTDLSLFAGITTLAILVGYLNARWIKWQASIATMLGSLVLSLILLGMSHIGFENTEHQIEALLRQLDFHTILMNGMLSFLLFAGALTLDLTSMREQKWEIGILSSLGTIASTLLIATACYYLLPLVGLQLSFIYCLLFGALISPTDPIAVLAIFKQVGVPKRLDTCLAGEALFNDGVAVVIFTTLYQLAINGHQPTFSAISTLFLKQAIGGIAYGLLLGWLGYRLIRPLDDYKMETFVTIAITTGGYAFAQWIDISGPLAMVVAGLFIGNHKRELLMSKQNRDRFDHFWEMIDELLNAILFLLLGFEVIVINFHSPIYIAALLMIPLVLFVRYITVGIPLGLLKTNKRYHNHTINILTWGGLRGGLAVALALAIPLGAERNLILAMTYAVVVFSIVVQGSSMKALITKTLPQ